MTWKTKCRLSRPTAFNFVKKSALEKDIADKDGEACENIKEKPAIYTKSGYPYLLMQIARSCYVQKCFPILKRCPSSLSKYATEMVVDQEIAHPIF
ncbi:hypothetical protein HOLleu_07856 [Holothuria leucospilota]|uniref:Uncharacterized protein n=1 Tax=Holothuria leucospilota TaxID=206669 RepID=A0A9Q1CGL7_HOLLE|nr:hypothetical protein HOLleu_07856 [Holothuria leucospilota]